MATFDHVASDPGHPASGVGSAFGTNPTAGNTLIVGAVWTTSDSIPTIASANGNSFVLAASEIQGGGASGAAVWVANNCNGGAETVTLTLAGQNFDITKSEYAKGTNPLQVDQVASNHATSTNPNSGNTPVTSAANELVYGFVVAQTTMPTAGSGFTIRTSSAFNINAACEDKVVSSTGAQAASFTSASQFWICICVTLMEAGSGAATSFLLGQGCM